MDKLKKLLQKLSGAPGISGVEGNVADIIKDELKGHADSVRRDALGNLILKKGEGKLKIMICAHMDEVGFIVKYISKEGFIRFIRSGGIDPRNLPSQRVQVYTKGKVINGVIGVKPPHLQKEEEQKKPYELESLFIDIGAKNKKHVEDMGIEIGDPIVFDKKFMNLTNTDLVCGNALDNRIGCAILIEVMKQFDGKDITLYCVGSVQEEVGLKGAKTSVFGIEPDVALAVDTAIAGGTPNIKEEEVAIQIGDGPVLGLIEAAGRGLIVQKKIKDWLTQTAKKNKIPYQLEVIEGGVTDGTAMQISKTGIYTGTIQVATRYLHSPVEVASLKDIDNAIKLTIAALKNAKKQT